MMNICADCGHVFDDDEIRICYERHGMDGPAEQVPCCPCCGSPDIREAEQCEICGVWYPADTVYGGCCKDCLRWWATTSRVTRYAFSSADMAEDFFRFWLELDDQRSFTEYAAGILRKAWSAYIGAEPAAAATICRGFAAEDWTGFAEWLKGEFNR